MSNDEKLTVLEKKEEWYNPLFVNDIELENILFYNSTDGVIFQTTKDGLRVQTLILLLYLENAIIEEK